MCKDDQTESINYVEAGSKLVNGQHKLRCALDYSKASKKNQNVGKPSSTRESKDSFEPDSITLDSSGNKKFILKTKDEKGGLSVSLDSVDNPTKQEEEHKMLPAVFADKFTVTIYYTPLESGFPSEKEDVSIIYPDGTTHTHRLNKVFMPAVKREGWGRMESAIEVNNISYEYINGGGRLSQKAEQRDGTALVDKTTCAGDETLFKVGSSKVKILLPQPWAGRFGKTEFDVNDVGAGVKNNHIDIYWKEDNPASLTHYDIPASFKDIGSPEGTYQVILLDL